MCAWAGLCTQQARECSCLLLLLQVRNYEVYRLLEESLKAMLTSLPLVQVGRKTSPAGGLVLCMLDSAVCCFHCSCASTPSITPTYH